MDEPYSVPSDSLSPDVTVVMTVRELRRVIADSMEEIEPELAKARAERDSYQALVLEHHAIGALDDWKVGAICPVCFKRAHPSIRKDMGLSKETDNG